jgi:hypothetical protein
MQSTHDARQQQEQVIWFVNVAPDKVRALTEDQLEAAYLNGSIDEDTLVRKDGELAWSKLGATSAVAPHEREDDLVIELLPATAQPRSSPPPLPARATKPHMATPLATPFAGGRWKRLRAWASLRAKKLRTAIRRRPAAAVGMAVGVLSFVAVLLFAGVGRHHASPTPGWVANAPHPLAKVAPTVLAAPNKVVAPVHPVAATKPAQAAPVHPHPAVARPAPAFAPAAPRKAAPAIKRPSPPARPAATGHGGAPPHH